jgi:hypothetical protein
MPMDDLSLDQLLKVFARAGATTIFAKRLAANDNSKNQVYLAGDFRLLNELPLRSVHVVPSKSGRPTMHAELPAFWLRDDGQLTPAPHSKAILYPDYPEVRWSGFLLGADGASNERMNERARIAGRVLLIGVRGDRTIVARVQLPESPVARELERLGVFGRGGVLVPILLEDPEDERDRLFGALKRVADMGWIDPVRLTRDGTMTPCRGTNCGGVTLESWLGIAPNAKAEPDFLGWEIKQFAVADFERFRARSPVTLFTPEPTIGIYASHGVETFIRQYGYPDTLGRPDRLNVGGKFVVGKRGDRTGLTLKLTGLSADGNTIDDASGGVTLVDDNGIVAAGWPFAALIEHWNHKHARAAYVPSLKRDPPPQYRYAPACFLGTGTDFGRFLKAMSVGHVYYDPGIKLESASTSHPAVKRRSQFRIAFPDLRTLYHKFEHALFDQAP